MLLYTYNVENKRKNSVQKGENMSNFVKSKRYDGIYSYYDKNNDKKYMYRTRYYNEKGERKEKRKQGFTSEKDAYRALLELQIAIEEEEITAVESTNITVSQWADKWLQMNRTSWKPTTYNQRRNCVNYQVKGSIGHIKLHKLDLMTYQMLFIDPLVDSKKYEASTIKLFHTIVKIMVNAAVDAELIKKNKITKAMLPKIEKKEYIYEDNYYTFEEMQHFLKCAEKDESETAKMAFKILAATGMRKGECQALRWDNVVVEDERFYITIDSTRDRVGERKPKTDNSYRKIEISQELYNDLIRYKIWCKKVCLFYGKTFKKENLLLISQQTGDAISDTFIGSALKRIIRVNELKEITPHGFRHTLATIYINEGIPIPTIAKILGNTPQMIIDVYAHSIAEKELLATEISRKINII